MNNIVLFIDSLVAGGAQRQLVVLACALADRGHKVEVVTYHDNDQLAPFLAKKQIAWKLIKKSAWLDFGFIWALYRYLRNKKPDVIISYLNTPNLWARLVGRVAGIKKIITSERNIDIDKSKVRLLIEQTIYPLSSKIVVNSNAIKQLLIKHNIPEERIETIYNGLDTDYFSEADKRAVSRFRAGLGIAQDDFILMLPGRIMQQKNHLGLMRAISMLESIPETLKIVFVGNEIDGSIKQQLMQLIEQNGLIQQVIFAGVQDNMPLVYSASDLVVLPSLWEGLPNVVIEAMSCGRATLVTDVSDNALVVEHGKQGFVVPVNDDLELAKQLRTCLSMSKSELLVLGARAKNKVNSICGLRRFCDAYEQLLR